MTGLTLDMGQYAAFVWPAWGASLLGLAFVVVRTLMAARRWSKALKDEAKR